MKIICIGRNYSAHAKEMGAETPKEPILFLKPETALLRDTHFYYPKFTNDLHFECELVVKINRMGKNIEVAHAHKYYNEISLGIDFTARDLQKTCKEKGLPWEISKAFDNSAFVSTIWIKKNTIDENNIAFSLEQNNKIMQQGNSNNMLFQIDSLIAHITKYFTLKTGDLIFTGTPEGVGPIQIGDKLVGKIGQTEMFNISIR